MHENEKQCMCVYHCGFPPAFMPLNLPHDVKSHDEEPIDRPWKTRVEEERLKRKHRVRWSDGLGMES